MYMRTVKMHVRRDDLTAFSRTYERHVLPAFAKVEGCLSAVLMQSTREPEECVSLTFWETDTHIRTFEEGGQYDELVGILRAFFIERYELQVRLTPDLKLDYGSSDEPEVRKYETAAAPGQISTDEIIIRMVSLKFKPGMVGEFQKHYQEQVVPALQKLRGCMLAFLAAPADSSNELISVTEWESEEAAQEYEHGGMFAALLESQRKYFATLVDLKLEGDKERKAITATSDDIGVDKHKILVGRRF